MQWFWFVVKNSRGGGGGGTWSMNIRVGADGKSEKLSCPGVKFLKMIPCRGLKFS